MVVHILWAIVCILSLPTVRLDRNDAYQYSPHEIKAVHEAVMGEEVRCNNPWWWEDDGERLVDLDIWRENQSQKLTAKGTASFRLPFKLGSG